MLTATFSNGAKVNAIILDERVKEVQGIAECPGCGAKTVLINPDNPYGYPSRFGGWMTKELETFAYGHECQPTDSRGS